MAKSKSKNSFVSKILSVLAIVVSLLTSLALFLNVWVWKTTNSGGEITKDIGGYFEDFKDYENLFKIADEELPVWGSTLAGIMVIVALVAAVILTVCLIAKLINKSNKTLNSVAKIACVVMILAGIMALVGSVAFVVKEIGSNIVSSFTMAFGAIAGFTFPILGGFLGFVAVKK